MFSLLLSSALAFAQPAPPTTAAPQPPEEIKPIRMAHAHAHIWKSTYKGVPGGQLEQRDSLCEKDFEIPVLDLRAIKSNNWYYVLGNVKCDAVLGSQPVEVSANAGITLNTETSGSPAMDRKSFRASLYVYPHPGQGADATYTAQGAAWTTDLNSKYLGFDLEPNVLWNCGIPKDSNPVPCRASLDEAFMASVEITD